MSSSFGDRVSELLRSFSPFERFLFGGLLLVFTFSLFFVARDVSRALMVDVPAGGGELVEGVVGSPRFINPLLAASAADRDLTSLVYAGLMRPRADGTLGPDLAERFSISEDGLTYVFILRDDARFHDGTPVTADDVVYTVTMAQDPALKSNKFANWEGVVVEKVSEREVRFVLPEPYAPFLENTTLGIMPKHLWESTGVEDFPFSHFNVEPVGAGPFTFDQITRNDVGIPEEYVLTRFESYVLGTPHIETLRFHFYRNENDLIAAFNSGDIDNLHGIPASRISELETQTHTVHRVPLPRIFGVFFNKNRNDLFTSKNIRRALASTVDREKLIEDVLHGYGAPLTGPVPLNVLSASPASTTYQVYDEEEAARALSRDGWQRISGTWYEGDDVTARPLSFTLATANTPELRHAAEIIIEDWREFGVDVTLDIYEPSDLTNNIIRPRRYDALFFGEVAGRGLDLFAFWHSSQRNDPGLNIAMYTNVQADALLDRARSEHDLEERLDAYRTFNDEIEADVPAVFTHSPDFMYVTPSTLQNISIEAATIPSERFLNVHEWFLETDRVWSVFQ